MALGSFSVGCATRPEVLPQSSNIDRMLKDGARVMWVAAHPDDEALVGAIMAKASLALGNPLYFLIFTHGDGGECCLPEGCKPDVKTIRAGEMKRAAALYHAELEHHAFFNAPLPVESFPKRHEIARIWADQGSPDRICAQAIRRFKPDLLLTFDPFNGFTGHPEHQITSRFATAGVRLATDERENLQGLETHRVDSVYYGLNRLFPSVLAGSADPEPVTEVWDATQPCIGGKTCVEKMAEISFAHKTQANDMRMVRMLSRWITRLHLRKADPFEEILDPFEVVA